MSQKKLETLLLPTLQFYVPTELIGRSDVRISTEFKRVSDTEIGCNVWISIDGMSTMHFLKTGNLPYYPDDGEQINTIVNAILQNDEMIDKIITFVRNYENHQIRTNCRKTRGKPIPVQ